MSAYNSLYKKTEVHVTEMFQKQHPVHLVLHNFDHTESVVKKTNEIAGHYNLSEEDMLVVFVAAWFHDTGYLNGKPEDHELRSIELMKEFMQAQSVDEGTIEKIESCILATKAPRQPLDLNAEILCDADTYQFGCKKEFKRTNKLAFDEANYFSDLKLTKNVFDERTVKLLSEYLISSLLCIDFRITSVLSLACFSS